MVKLMLTRLMHILNSHRVQAQIWIILNWYSLPKLLSMEISNCIHSKHGQVVETQNMKLQILKNMHGVNPQQLIVLTVLTNSILWNWRILLSANVKWTSSKIVHLLWMVRQLLPVHGLKLISHSVWRLIWQFFMLHIIQITVLLVKLLNIIWLRKQNSLMLLKLFIVR